jgi:hypothetical protein
MLYIQTDFTSRFKHMYHTIMTTMVPKYTWFRLHPLNFCNIVAILKESNFPESLRGRPFNLKGGIMVFCFVQNFFSGQLQELEFFFFCRAKRKFFSPEFNIWLYDKNSESDYFFSPPLKSEYFFQQHWESEYFFRKKP